MYSKSSLFRGFVSCRYPEMSTVKNSAAKLSAMRNKLNAALLPSSGSITLRGILGARVFSGISSCRNSEGNCGELSFSSVTSTCTDWMVSRPSPKLAWMVRLYPACCSLSRGRDVLNTPVRGSMKNCLSSFPLTTL